MITVMLLKENRIAVGVGTYVGVNVIQCETDGTIDFIWKSGNTPTTYEMTEGKAVMLDPTECTKVIVSSGTFSFS